MNGIITIKKLRQEEADSIMKGLSGEPLENFKKGFHVEEENLSKGHTWALPPPGVQSGTSENANRRIYYLVALNEVSYLLIGINPTPPNSILLSSFARINTRQGKMAGQSLKKFIEDILIPMCRETGKTAIAARIASDRADKVFRHLQRALPRGIRAIRINGSACFIEIDIVDG